MVELSFLVPTRGRTAQVRRLFNSIIETTSRPESLEVILGVDDDDVASQAITDHRLPLKTVVVPRGSAMGVLNRSCFDAASGRFVMLMNDDVVLRTNGWDRIVSSAASEYPDDIVLIHVNDLLFKDTLCTFPILSRRACLEIGVCTAEYRRYRIDDDIYDIYNMLAHLGQRRITYLEKVIFEHHNFTTESQSDPAHLYRAGNKVYVPDQSIIEADARLFDTRLEARKHSALRLARLIDETHLALKEREYRERLTDVRDSHGYRQPAFVKRRPLRLVDDPVSKASTTVAVVTSDLYQSHAEDCVRRLKKHSSSVDVLILDNHHRKEFNHPSEMNKALAAATGDFIVLMDDDVLVEEGWLQGLLESVDDETGIVAPLHRDKAGRTSFSGVYLKGDDFGSHGHHTDIPDGVRPSQAVCSALVLIDRRKCGHLRFAERFKKYFLDLDYSFHVWESGYKVVVTPRTTVTHLAGATMHHGSSASQRLWNRDMALFSSEWMASGRLDRLEQNIWSRFPFVSELAALTGRIRAVGASQSASWEFSRFRAEIEELVRDASRFELLGALLLDKIRDCERLYAQRGDTLKSQYASAIARRLARFASVAAGPVPILVGSHNGYNFVEYDRQTYGIPQSLGSIDLSREQDRQKPGIVFASSPDVLKEQLDRGSPVMVDGLADVPYQGGSHERPRLVLEGYRRFNVVLFASKYFAVPQGEGSFDIARIQANSYSRWRVGDTLHEVKQALDQVSPQQPVAIRGLRRLLGRATAGPSQPIHGGASEGPRVNVGRALVVCPGRRSAATCISRLDGELTLLSSRSLRDPVKGNRGLVYRDRSGAESDRVDLTDVHPDLLAQLTHARFDTVVLIPERGIVHDRTGAEKLASLLGCRLSIMSPNGRSRSYKGEDLHRISYNKAYLESMLQVVPSLRNKSLLEVGCSDGLVCDMLLGEQPDSIVGVDMLETVGCGYPNERITYLRMDGSSLRFKDQSFDLAYSIATLEHCSDPIKVLSEMKRVTKTGGFCYVQAGPLYYSPFGHHMFGYFDDYPWIHLRASVQAIVERCRKTDIEQRIKQVLGRSADDYVAGMLSSQHINGKKYVEYGLEAFCADPSVRVLKHNRSWEGEELVTEDILKELPGLSKDDLVAHGFELAFQVIR